MIEHNSAILYAFGLYRKLNKLCFFIKTIIQFANYVFDVSVQDFLISLFNGLKLEITTAKRISESSNYLRKPHKIEEEFLKLDIVFVIYF